MTYTPRLVTVAEVRQAIGQAQPGQGEWAVGGTAEQAILRVIEASEARIFDLCADRFDLVGDPSPRNYRCDTNSLLLTDRYQTVSEVAVYLDTDLNDDPVVLDERQWHQPTKPLIGDRPTKDIEGYGLLAGRWYRVTARWGWVSIPSQAREAALLLASRLYSRERTPLGIVAGDIPMYASSKDNDVRALLGSLIYVPGLI